MTLKFGSSFSCLPPSLAPHSQLRRGSQLSLLQARYGSQQSSAQQLQYAKGRSCTFLNKVQKSSKRIIKAATTVAPKWLTRGDAYCIMENVDVVR